MVGTLVQMRGFRYCVSKNTIDRPGVVGSFFVQVQVKSTHVCHVLCWCPLSTTNFPTKIEDIMPPGLLLLFFIAKLIIRRSTAEVQVRGPRFWLKLKIGLPNRKITCHEESRE